LPSAIKRDEVVNAGIGIDVVQAHPDAEFAQRPGQFEQARLHRLAAPEPGAVLDVDAVGAGVLRDDEQFLDAGGDEVLRLAHDVADGAADEVAAQRGDDAEGAAVVAALGNLEIGVVPRRQLDSLRRHQVLERIVGFRQVLVHLLHHLLGGMRAGDGEHLRVGGQHHVLLGAQAAGDDDAAVLVERLADGVERLGHRGIDEAAGVHHDEVGALVVGHDGVAFCAQARQDLFGVDEGFRTAEGDEAHLGRGDFLARHSVGGACGRVRAAALRLLLLWRLLFALPSSRRAGRPARRNWGIGSRRTCCASGFRSAPASA
jgi:hypothetical protein